MTIRAFPKTVGRSAPKLQEDRKNEGHGRDSTMSFLSPQFLGLIKDWWQTHEVLPHQDIIKRLEEEQRYAFCTPLKVSLKAFHRKKVMAKTAQGTPRDLRTSPGHN